LKKESKKSELLTQLNIEKIEFLMVEKCLKNQKNTPWGLALCLSGRFLGYREDEFQVFLALF